MRFASYLEVSVGSDREACFADVNPHEAEVPRNGDLFIVRQCGSGGLLSIAESGI